MKRILYVVLKQEVKTRRTSVVSVHYHLFEAEHIADVEFNSLCLDDQAEFNYLVCNIVCRELCYQKGDTPRGCFDRTAAAPANRFCFYYKVRNTYSLKRKAGAR